MCGGMVVSSHKTGNERVYSTGSGNRWVAEFMRDVDAGILKPLVVLAEARSAFRDPSLGGLAVIGFAHPLTRVAFAI